MAEQVIKGMQWISIGAIIVGLLFIIAGSITTGIAYTEITPPNYDDNYDRYIGSSVPRLMGPFILCFGAIIILASCGVMILEAKKDYQRIPQNNQMPKQNFGKDDDSMPPHKSMDESV